MVMTTKQKTNPKCTNPLMMIPISSLSPWKDNYNEGDIGAIAASIARFGFNGALRVWRDNTVIGGNHSLLALMSLKAGGPHKGVAWPPTHIMTDKTTDEWLVPCIDVSHLDELDAQAFSIADNDIARKATQNANLKAKYLIELHQQRPESLAAAGWDVDDLDAFLSTLSGDLRDVPFDATKLEDAYVPDASIVPPGTYIVYVSFDDREEFDRFLHIVNPERPVELAKQYAAVRSEDVMQHMSDLDSEDFGDPQVDS